jgi:hypothetical protein
MKIKLNQNDFKLIADFLEKTPVVEFEINRHSETSTSYCIDVSYVDGDGNNTIVPIVTKDIMWSWE